jgi:hypothetical protein
MDEGVYFSKGATARWLLVIHGISVPDHFQYVLTWSGSKEEQMNYKPLMKPLHILALKIGNLSQGAFPIGI